jgi:hypothetical protein
VAHAAAVLAGREPPPAVFFNTCYSHVGPEYGISVVNVYRGTPERFIEVPNSGGISLRTSALGPEAADFRRREAIYADGWYESITQAMFGIA